MQLGREMAEKSEILSSTAGNDDKLLLLQSQSVIWTGLSV